jgi:putative ABC transport system permease protein
MAEMRAILRQVKANIRSRRLQSALIVATLMAAALLLTLALSTFRTAQVSYDRLFRRTRGAHLWLELDPERVTQEEAEEALVDLPGVEASTGVVPYVHLGLLVGERREGIRLGEWPDEPVTVGRLLLMDGRAPKPGEMDAIALDRNWAEEYGLEVGEPVQLLTSTGQRPMTINALFVSAQFCPYPCYGPILAYVAPGALKALGLLPPPSLEMKELVIGLRLKRPVDPDAARQAAKERLPAESVVSTVGWEDIRADSDSNILPRRVLLLTFSIVAGLAAGFLIANTVGGAVRAQTRQIGLLKAVGFTGGQLTLVYLTECLGLALVASLAGLAAGGLLTPLILRPLTIQFGEPMALPPLWSVVVAPLGTLLITALFALWPVRRAMRLDAVQAIRMGAEQPRRRRVRLLRLPLPLAVGLSEPLSRPQRSVMTTLGLAMAVLALISALAIKTTLQSLLGDPAMGHLADGDLSLARPRYLADKEVRRMIAEQSDVVAYFTQRWGIFRFPEEEEPYYAIFREGDLESFRFPLVEGQMLNGPDQAVVGYGLVRERGLQPGDGITIELAGELMTFQVVGVFRTSNQKGRMLILPLEARRRVEPDFETFMYWLKLCPDADAGAVAAALTSASSGLLETELLGEEALPGWVTSLETVTAALSLVLGGIATLGVLNSVWMAVREREREFGLLKAVGMTPQQITLSVLIGATGIALLAYAVGLPAGVIGIDLLMDAVARAVGFGPLHPSLGKVELVLLLPGIVLLATLGAFLPAYRAGRTSVMDALRYEW